MTAIPDEPQILQVGSPSERRPIAFRRRPPARVGLPGLVWLPGFRSDMASTKASALDAHCAERGQGLLRFDYSGHGASGGRFEDGTVSRWLEECLAIIRAESEGPQLLVGSSMGGYLALLAARALAASGETARLAGMVLIAPAVDFTEALMWARASEAERHTLMADGVWERPTDYAAEPYRITRALIEDGRRHLLLGATVRSHCPARILQGMRDTDVPYRHALTLIEHMAADPVTLTLIKDGDHRLSRPQDLALLMEAIDSFA
ncbi:MAG: alpha/beta hydrolase [Bradyrhizobium sp.]|nr:MAG: alpha/beta hydrolase [Bradyrhizobium sp.]